MQLRLLGTGSPAALPQRQVSAVLLSLGRQHLLFDAGRGVTTQLVRAGVAPHELGAIFLTHHHYDHIGNLGDVLLTAWHGGVSTLPIFGPSGTDRIVQALFDQVYNREILFSLALHRAIGAPMRDIRDVVTVGIVSAGQPHQLGPWRVVAAEVEHGHRLGLTQAEWPCLGYRIEIDGKRIVISGDCVRCASLIALAKDADVLVQCCFLADAALTNPARQLVADVVIASSGQVGRIAQEAGVKTLVLTHFGDMSLELLSAAEADVRRHYAGPVHVGEDLFMVEI